MPIPSAPLPMWFADTDPRRGRAPDARPVPPARGAPGDRPGPVAVSGSSWGRGTPVLVGALSGLVAGLLRSAIGAATARRRTGSRRSA